MIYIHWIFLLIYIMVIVSIIVTILMDNRQPAKTMAWVMVLLFVPVAGIILYIFFGQNTRKMRFISQRSLDQLSKRQMLEFVEQRELRMPDKFQSLVRLFTNQSLALPFKDNEAEFYTDGYQFFPALLQAISRARHHIHLETYIFDDDPLGRLIADALIHKAKKGVEIRVIYDDVGCWRVPSAFFERMKKAGIDVCAFMPVKFPAFTSKVNYRNHRKIVVIDGRIGFVGGMNLAERYMRGFSWGIWRDTHLLLEGKAVHGLQTAFLLDWYFVDRTLISASRYFPKMEASGNSLVQIVTSDPIGPWKEIMQGLSMAISGAKKYFYIQTPYFLPTEQILAAMQTAALAGVDVRLMLPLRADNRLTNLGSCSYLADVLQAGVKVYFYKIGFLHSKLMVSDDELTTVGSTNVDFRSFEHNFEVNAFIYDTETALQMREIFLQDQRECVQVFLKNWVKRPWWRKAAESVVRLMAPLL